MTCPNPDLLSAFFDGEVEPPWSERINAHVGECSRCQQTLTRFRSLRRLLHEDREPPVDVVLARTRDRLESSLRASGWRRLRFWQTRVSVPLPAVAAMFLVFLRTLSIDIFVRRYDLPPIFREAVVFFPGRRSGHNLRTVKIGAAVDYRVIFLKKAPGALRARGVDTGHEEDPSVLGGEFGEVVKKGVFSRFLSIYAQVQIARRLRLILLFF